MVTSMQNSAVTGGAAGGQRQRQAADLSPTWYRLLSTAVLLLMFGLALTSMVQKAPTFDEQGFLVRGLAALRGYPQIRVGHPLGLNAFNAALLAGDERVALPVDAPSWGGTDFHRPAELFLWEIGNDVAHIMFLGRLPTLWLGLLLAALTGRWAGQLARRRWVGLLALLFVALDPNILAHTRLSTTDLGLAAFALLAGYNLWRFLRRPSWALALLAGASMGLLQNTKFTALLFVPLFALVMLVGLGLMWGRNRRADPQASLFGAAPWRELLMVLVAYPLAALLALWIANGFNIGTLPEDLPAFPSLGGLALPLASYLEQLLDIFGRLQVQTPSFLLGQYSDNGWWYYFPVTFLLKTPLPTLLLIGWGFAAYLLCLLRRGKACPSLLDSAALLVPALGYFAIALTSEINLGYRHLLPLLPFLTIFSTTAVSRALRPETLLRLAPAFGLSAWLAATALLIYPDFLAYFNLLAGGADGGWRALVDSNLDWGQDLDDLAPWMAANGVDQVWLSYFGEARPDYYGIAYQGLDSFPPRLVNPQARPFYPSDPAPGVYAISATNLQGVHFADHDQFAFFRERPPLEKLGYSIFLYDVPARGRAQNLALSGLQLDQIAPQAHARLGTNDVRPRWFDLQHSLIIPAGDETWLAMPADQVVHPAFVPLLDGRLSESVEEDGIRLGRLARPELPDRALTGFTGAGGQVDLLLAAPLDEDDAHLTLLTAWRQNSAPRPLKIFVHALDQDGRIVAQWDGLDAPWEGWQAGDVLLQLHRLEVPDGQDRSSLRLVTGLYDPQSGVRWLAEAGSGYFAIEPSSTENE